MALNNYFSMKITKNRYLASFSLVVFFLTLIRILFPNTAHNISKLEINYSTNAERKVANATEQKNNSNNGKVITKSLKDNLSQKKDRKSLIDSKNDIPQKNILPNSNEPTRFFNRNGNIIKNRIISVPNYSNAFPDSQQVQIMAANKWGTSPVINRKDAETRKKELVYIGSNPYYHTDKMYRSIPYLVPRAAILLNDMGRAFYDSLQLKGIPLHQFIVTSVLRTKEDVSKLRNYNGNATENSCHLYGTTFDICYNRYKTIETKGTPKRKVRNDTLKWVLSEMLNDMRNEKRCYIKYEVKQGCFHITVR